MIKLIATDLDGTLMAPDHLTVTDRTYKFQKTHFESKNIQQSLLQACPQ